MRGTTLNTKIHPTQPRGGHPSHSNLVRGKLTSPTPNPAGDGTSGLTSYPRRRSNVSEATCLRPQRGAPSRTRTRTRPTQSPALWPLGHSRLTITTEQTLRLFRGPKNYYEERSSLFRRCAIRIGLGYADTREAWVLFEQPRNKR